jgi:hypothetical protein
MNHKVNWEKRGRMSGAVSGIPVRFEPGYGFDIKVKKSSGKSRATNLEPLLVPELLDLHTRGGRTHAQVLRALPLYKRGSPMTPVPLEERMLDQRRLEAVFKTGRKKR